MRGEGEPDLWQNARRYRGGSGSPRPSAKIPTKTLKEALKHRPPVSAYVREITRASELDRQREMERRRMER
jgi:sirohydrochlorin ferrochelatase